MCIHILTQLKLEVRIKLRQLQSYSISLMNLSNREPSNESILDVLAVPYVLFGASNTNLN